MSQPGFPPFMYLHHLRRKISGRLYSVKGEEKSQYRQYVKQNGSLVADPSVSPATMEEVKAA